MREKNESAPCAPPAPTRGPIASDWITQDPNNSDRFTITGCGSSRLPLTRPIVVRFGGPRGALIIEDAGESEP